MEKKAKIIATLGPAIYNETKLKQLVKLGVDAFRINFSHETKNISSIVKRIRKVERSTDKKIALIADLQGVKLRVGKIKDNVQKIKFNQKFTFDAKKDLGNKDFQITYAKKGKFKLIGSTPVLVLKDGATITSKKNEITNPFIRELLNFGGVELVLLSKNFLSVKKTKEASWEELKPMVISHLNDYFEKNKQTK